ncbi:TPA: DUF1858 domain-containing protein [Candidatus Berkelbacteria bacterium]|uniref:Hybrid cluster protein-associated redox disulfide domain-containing protein n=1 Tax=Berkelbacteria bacterium GW2011_GWE1_39_12 TaxID=1618337 RepID=A0A0G4B526_9BACT|nr:MAG: Hybrid cluster protein-associated redox disulfide domain-containing protein [Berkelbacteria bacterium GW2011_GWE1_39_12]HBO60681.1 DUF1858 domain-containing protein [Candidatus Berkelbacteria bacterium]
MENDKKITADDTIGSVLESHPEKAEIMAKKLKATCFGCPMSQIESLKDAADHHGVDLDSLLEELNKK